MTPTYFSLLPKEINCEIAGYLSFSEQLHLYQKIDSRLDAAIHFLFFQKSLAERQKQYSALLMSNLAYEKLLRSIEADLAVEAKLWTRIRRFLCQGTIADSIDPTPRELNKRRIELLAKQQRVASEIVVFKKLRAGL